MIQEKINPSNFPLCKFYIKRQKNNLQQKKYTK